MVVKILKTKTNFKEEVGGYNIVIIIECVRLLEKGNPSVIDGAVLDVKGHIKMTTSIIKVNIICLWTFSKKTQTKINP